MIEVTLKEILGSADSLKMLSEKDIPKKLSFILKRIIKKCQEEINTWNDVRIKSSKELDLIIPIDEKNMDAVKKREENNNKFQKEMIDLLEVKVKLDVDMIKYDEFDLPKASGKLVTDLDWLILEN